MSGLVNAVNISVRGVKPVRQRRTEKNTKISCDRLNFANEYLSILTNKSTVVKKMMEASHRAIRHQRQSVGPSTGSCS